LSLAVFSLLAIGNRASAAVEFFDTSTSANLQSGSGTWDVNSTASWSSVTTGSNPLLVWTDGNDATFQTAGTNTVTLSGSVTVGTLLQNGSGNVTTISSGTGITVNTAITNNTNGTAFTINSAVTLNGASVAVSPQGSTGSSVVLAGNIGETGGARVLRIGGAVGNNVKLSGTNTFSGGIQQNAASQLEATQAAALGAGGVGISTNSTATTTLNLNFASNGTASNAFKFNLGGTGAAGGVTISSNGAGAANLSNSSAITFGSFVGGSNALGLLTINFGGTNTGGNTFAGLIKNSGTGLNITSIVKKDAGKWIFTNANTYTGTTTVNGGTLSLGATNVINNSATNGITLGGGTLESAFSQNLSSATLSLTAATASILDLSTAGTFVFADSHLATWGTGSSLSIIGTFVDNSSVRFGIDGSGLSGTQVGQITINGLAAGIDSNGYLFASIPEPSTYAALAGIVMLGFGAVRRSREK